MLFRPMKHPLNWFQYDVAGSIELLEVYVSDIELQVESGIASFTKNAKEIVVEQNHFGEHARTVKIYNSLDDETWDLQSVFLEYYPSLQRRSALITLYSFFEHELNKVCLLFQSTEKYEVLLADTSRKERGILRARTYLNEIALLNLEQSSSHWKNIREIQSLRNLLVHADGKLNSLRHAKEIQYIQKCEFLEGNEEITIHTGYLKHVLTVFNDCFTEINDAIQHRYNAKPSTPNDSQ
jgi:hypothetical protein